MREHNYIAAHRRQLVNRNGIAHANTFQLYHFHNTRRIYLLAGRLYLTLSFISYRLNQQPCRSPRTSASSP